MSQNLKKHVNTGLAPRTFMDGMTKNQEAFQKWYDEFAWPSAEDQAFFEDVSGGNLHCLIIAADWCGDVVRNVPVVFRVMEAAKIPTEVLIMEENLDVIDSFLTFGGRSIPVVLFVNEAGDVVGRWGPRPEYVQEPMAEFKKQNLDRESPEYDEKIRAARQEVVRRYGEGAGYQKDIVSELRAIVRSATK